MQEQIKDSQNIDTRVSERISFLRFPLCIGVVLYHSFAWLPKGTEYLTTNLSEYLVRFLDIFVGKQAVLVFFIISGYLLRKKNDKYLIALKKRVKTLLIPFIIWPLLNLALFISYEYVTHNLNSYIDSLKNTYPNILSFYIGYGSDMFLGHFWYVRDLIGLVIISPILLYPPPDTTIQRSF